jgi:hypothetical protein
MRAVDAGAQADKPDEYIEAEMLKQHIPSLSLDGSRRRPRDLLYG